MANKNWKTSYGNQDHVQMVAEIVLDFFVELGKDVIEAKDQNTKILAGGLPNNIMEMRNIGFELNNLSGSFNCGDEAIVCQKLFGVNSMSYRLFFERVYEEAIKNAKGEHVYIRHESLINPSKFSFENQYKFSDLYNFIQVAERDGYGYHRLTEEIAMHIYSGKAQVNICKINLYGHYDSMLNIVFMHASHNENEKIVKIFDVSPSGTVDYNNPRVIVDTDQIIFGVNIPYNIKEIIIKALQK